MEGENALFLNAQQPTVTTEEPPQKRTGRLIKTVVLAAAFLGLGLAIAITGPTLPYLQSQVNVGTDEIGVMFTGRSVGYLVGSMGTGWLFDHFTGHHDLMFTISLLVNAVCLALAPWTSSLVALALLTTTTGLAMGLLDTGGNADCLLLWGKRSPPYLQSLHFSFGVGAVLAPLIAAPFLESSVTVNATASILAVDGDHGNASSYSSVSVYSTTAYPPAANESSARLPAANESLSTEDVFADKMPVMHHRKMFDARIDNVQFVYLLISSFLLAVTMAFAAFEVRRCITGATQKVSPKDSSGEQQKRSDRPFLIRMLTLMFFFYVFYCGLEVAYGQFVATFALQHSGFTENDASLLTAVFWGVFTLGRGCAIFVARYCSPTKMMFGSFACALTALLFLCFAQSMHGIVLWLFSGLLGLGLAAIFPTGFTWAEQHLHISNKVAAVFVVGASLGEMALPATIGYLISKAGSMYMMYALTGFCAVDLALFVLLCALARRRCCDRPRPYDAGTEDDGL